MINEIYAPEAKIYTVTRLDSYTNNEAGKQIQTTSEHTLELSCYDKGTKIIRKSKEESYTVAVLHVYTDLKVLNLLDQFFFNGLPYKVLEEKNYTQHSFYKAIANV